MHVGERHKGREGGGEAVATAAAAASPHERKRETRGEEDGRDRDDKRNAKSEGRHVGEACSAAKVQRSSKVRVAMPLTH